MQCGQIRRIGNGEATNVWQDRKILEAIGGRPVCPKPGAMAIHVCELMSADGLPWDDEALAHNLLDKDAQAVKRIQLGRRHEDFWAGRASDTGSTLCAQPTAW